MNELPIKIKTYVTAVQEATELSVKVNYPVYLFRLTDGGYVIDNQAEVYSNEKLLFSIFKGKVES